MSQDESFMPDISGYIWERVKMTDFSFVAILLWSCFDNTGYRIMWPAISAAGSQNMKKKEWILAETLTENTSKGGHILYKSFGYGV